MVSNGKQTTVKGSHTWYWDDPIHQYNLLCVSFLKLPSCQNPTHMVVVRWSNRWQRPHSTQPLESVSASTRTAMKPMAISGSGLYFTGCECWRDNICFLCHLAGGGATKFPQRQIFSVKTWIMSSQTLPHFQLYLCPEHNFLHGIDTKAKECIYSLICFLSFI